MRYCGKLCKRVFAVVVITLLLVACGEQWVPDSGTVVEHGYEDEYYSYIFTGKVMVPIYHPEEWYLRVDDGQKVGWVEVPRETYDAYQDGDHIEFEK